MAHSTGASSDARRPAAPVEPGAAGLVQLLPSRRVTADLQLCRLLRLLAGVRPAPQTTRRAEQAHPGSPPPSRLVRRAGRRNPPGESQAGRSGPTPTDSDPLPLGRCPEGRGVPDHRCLQGGRGVHHRLRRLAPPGGRAERRRLEEARDRGSQYLSGDYRDLIDDLGMRQSGGRTGVCRDNSVAEAAWSTLKRELVHRYVFPDRAAARRAIFAWISRYNTLRLSLEPRLRPADRVGAPVPSTPGRPGRGLPRPLRLKAPAGS